MRPSYITGMPVYSTNEIKLNPSLCVCVTGHRGRAVIPYNNDPKYASLTMRAFKLFLGRYIDNVMESGYIALLSGLAQGTDLLAADHVLGRKRFGGGKLIGVMPFFKHAAHLNERDLEILWRVERYADRLITTNDDPNIIYSRKPGPASRLYQERNYYLVDNSSIVIAFYNRENRCSGTGQTVSYAERCGKPVISFDMNDVYAFMERAELNKSKLISDALEINIDVPKAKPVPISIIP